MSAADSWVCAAKITSFRLVHLLFSGANRKRMIAGGELTADQINIFREKAEVKGRAL